MITPPDIKDRETVLAKWRDVIESTHIWSWTSHHELALLCEFASASHNILEVGSYLGKSAVCMAKANPNARISCIDLPQDDTTLAVLKIYVAKYKLNHLIGTTADWCPKWSGDRYDFAFLDGGHLYDDLVSDIKNVMPLMKAGGIISGHDWRRDNPLDGVNRAVEACFDKNEINVLESIWWIRVP